VSGHRFLGLGGSAPASIVVGGLAIKAFDTERAVWKTISRHAQHAGRRVVGEPSAFCNRRHGLRACREARRCQRLAPVTGPRQHEQVRERRRGQGPDRQPPDHAANPLDRVTRGFICERLSRRHSSDTQPGHSLAKQARMVRVLRRVGRGQFNTQTFQTRKTGSRVPAHGSFEETRSMTRARKRCNRSFGRSVIRPSKKLLTNATTVVNSIPREY